MPSSMPVVAGDRTSTEATQATDERLVVWLKALADARRLSILSMLMEGVQCNCEIAARLDVSLSLVSYHLKILSQAGLVQSAPDPDDARWSYYSIDTDTLEDLRARIGRLLDVGRIQPRDPSCGPQGCKDG